MVVYLICYLASFGFARKEWYLLSGLILIVAAVWLYIGDFRRSRNPIHLRGLFSLSWVGGQGIACLKLSEIQTDWEITTWVCFFLALVGFWFVFELMSRWFGDSFESSYSRHRFTANSKSIFACMSVLTVVSLGSFIFEAVWLGYIPLLLKGVPHAYSEFHVTGVHYFTVSCVLIPALSVIYFYTDRGRGSGRRAVAATMMDIAAIMIPILCVSRYQFIFAVQLLYT